MENVRGGALQLLELLLGLLALRDAVVDLALNRFLVGLHVRRWGWRDGYHVHLALFLLNLRMQFVFLFSDALNHVLIVIDRLFAALHVFEVGSIDRP